MSTCLTRLERLRPELAHALDDAVAQAYAACPNGLLALCQARIRTLLGGPVTTDDVKIRAIADYATSPLFSPLERLALEFTEQYVMDVAGMPAELVATLRDRLGAEGVYALTMGLYAVDQAERLRISSGVHPGSVR